MPTYLNQSGTFSLTGSRSVVLSSPGTYSITITGTFASTASICVINGAKLNLSFSNVSTIQKGGSIYVDKLSSLTLTGSNITKFPLTIHNEGATNQSTGIVYEDGATINNSGEYTSTDAVTFNSGTVTYNNSGYLKFTSTLAFNSGTFAINNKPGGDIDFGLRNTVVSKTNITNAGTMTFGGDVTLQNSSLITNYGYMYMKSNSHSGLLLGGVAVTNHGFMEVTGNLQINSGSTLTNNCTVYGKSDFTSNGTVINNSQLLFTKNSFTNQGTFTNGTAALVQGTAFTNTGSIKGGGRFYFTGTTSNSGTFAGTNGNYINFYDASNSSSSRIFDIQNTNPSSTTKNVVIPNTASTFVTCTDISAPAITAQPATAALCTSSATSATFSAAAAGYDNQVDYQWYKNGTAIAGAISSTYTAGNLTPADTADLYTVVVSNDAGTTTSSAASVKYVILSQPAPASLNRAAGASASFTMQATAGASIQWQFNNSNIAGATAATYTAAPLVLSNAGTYKAIVTYSGTSCTSNNATLTVENLPLIIKQPITQALCTSAANTAKLSVDASSTSSATYQWYKNGAAIPGATSKDLNLTQLTLADTANTYYAKVTNSVGTSQSNTASVKYLLLSQPAPLTQNLAAGAAFSLSLKAASGTAIQWLLENNNIAGAKAATYAKASAAVTDGGKYKAVVTYNGTGCTTDEAIVSVENLPLIIKQPITQALCTSAANTAKLSVDASSTSSATYQWYKNGAAIPGATSKDLNLTQLTLADTANTYYAKVTNSVGTSQSNTASVKYLLLSQPAPLTQSVIINSAASFSLKASAGTSIQWLLENNNITGATAATYSKAAAGVADGGKYKAVVTYNGTSCTSNEAILTIINPLAVITAQPAALQTFCSPSAAPSVTFGVVAASPSALSYQWYKKDAAIAGATASTFTATGLTVADTANPFRVVITNAAGKVTSNDAYVKYVIVAEPSPAMQIIATGNTASFTFKTSGATSLLWTKNGVNLPAATALSYALPVVNRADSGSYAALVTYPAGVCSTQPAVLKPSVVLYLKKDGAFNDPKNWGVAADGSGSSPLDFLRPEHTFVVANRAAAKTEGTLTIAGTLDIAASNLAIEDGHSLTVGRIIRSKPGGVLSASLKDSLTIQGIGASDLYFDKVYNTIQRLTINGSAVTLRTPLNIANNNGEKPNNNGILVVNAGTFYTSDSLTLKSDKNGTGSIGKSPGSIVGKVTVEKYINEKRSWRLMGAPVTAATAQTINEAYQEGAKSSTDNPKPGFGTHITYGALADGFDQNPQKSFSMKVFGNTGKWVGVPATNKTKVTDYPAYMLFIRGNRSYPITVTTDKTPASSTILRVTGSMNQGDQPARTVATSGITLVVNPYACPVNFTKINSASTNVKARIRMWDPLLFGSKGVGGWVTVDGTKGTYRATPPSALLTTIQAGQGFYVESADGVKTGSLIVNEDAKDLTGKTTSADREGEDNSAYTSLEVNLRIADTAGTYSIADGVLYYFGETENNNIDSDDALKIANFGANFSISENSSLLTIDSRTMPAAGDTLKLNLAGAATSVNYQFEFVPDNMGNKAFMLYDKYLGTLSPVNAEDTTRILFSTSKEAASKATDRFSLVLQKTLTVLPVTVTGIRAYRKENNVMVEWAVKAEQNMAQYEVETSTNGTSFSKAGTVAATGANAYSFVHTAAQTGTNYYRVKSVEKDGAAHYTSIVNVSFEGASTASAVSVYPNPLTGTSFTLTLSGMKAGIYDLAIVSQEGKQVYSRQVAHSGGTASQKLTLTNHPAAGIYYMILTAKDGTQTTTSVAATN